MIDFQDMRDFIDIYKCLEGIKSAVEESYPLDTIEKTCCSLQQALNRYMPDFRCMQIRFTSNTDKPFFGVWVKPTGMCPNALSSKMFNGLILPEEGELQFDFEPFKFSSYTLELDGQLFRKFGLNIHEIWALLLGDIIQMNSTTPVEKFRNMIDAYISLHNLHLDSKYLKETTEVFSMVTYITLHNITSIFSRYDFEAVGESPDLVSAYGLQSHYQDAVAKIIECGAKAGEVDTTGVLLSWYMSNYCGLAGSRWIEIMFRDALSTEASFTVKNMIMNCLNRGFNVKQSRLSDSDQLFYTKYIAESARPKRRNKGLIFQMKRNGLKSIEEDLFEYNMRLRNVETQDEAILLMRQINSRMSILEDYLRDDDTMVDEERKRWEECYRGYVSLRDALSKKTVYNRKMYGLFVDYNALQNMNQSGQLMNTYY